MLQLVFRSRCSQRRIGPKVDHIPQTPCLETCHKFRPQWSKADPHPANSRPIIHPDQIECTMSLWLFGASEFFEVFYLVVFLCHCVHEGVGTQFGRARDSGCGGIASASLNIIVVVVLVAPHHKCQSFISSFSCPFLLRPQCVTPVRGRSRFPRRRGWLSLSR